MKKKTLKSGIVITLSACMIANTVPFSAAAVRAAAESIVDFTDETSRGAWQKTSGNGSIAFTDGEGDAGYMTVSSDDNTIFADTATEKRADGYVEMDLTMTKAPNGGRMVIIFRYNSPTDWEGIGIDSGKWLWFSGSGGWGEVSAKKQSFTSEGESHRIRVEYRGKNIRVLEDGAEIINQDIQEFNTSKAGNIGMRLWGLVSENYDCAFRVDNVENGEVKELVNITPENFQIPYESAGQDDCEVTLSKETPALTEIRNGDVSLEEGVDYTIDGLKVTLKKEYIEKIKETLSTTLTFVFEDGQEKTCTIAIEKEEQDVTYKRNFKDGVQGFENVSGDGTMETGEDGVTVQGNGLFIDENSNVLKNQEVEFTYDPMNNNCNYGVVLRYTSPQDYLYVGPSSQNAQHYTNWGIYGPNGQLVNLQDSGFILQGRVEPYKVKVRVIDNVVTIFLDNEEIYNGEVDGITMNAGKTGFRTTANTGMTIQGFVQETAKSPKIVSETKEETISSEKMSVKVDANFPRVISYTLDSGETVKGQELAIHQLELNNKLYTPKVTAEISDSKATYHVEEEETGISFDVIFEVKDNVLSMNVKNIKDEKTKLYTLNFPGHSLVSMSSEEAGAKLTVNNYQGETRNNLADLKASDDYKETTLAVLSNDKAAAAISGESYKNRHEIAYRTFDVGGHTSTGLWMNEYTYRGLDGEVMYEPWTKVAITTDRNADGKVDYQDGAIALRDDCMKRKTGADITTERWNMVAMNVGSEAQYPFLRILDNAKKVSLATDNFGQNIIIKGYQSEGHDASHPDFANYNKRAGGLEDFNTLLENSEDFNTKIGIHINHTDVYPEAPQYGKLKTGLGAWSWYDSASQIVRENDDLDKSENGLDGRLAKLYDEDTKNQIDTTYVDVFFGTRWPMYKLIDNINGQGREMALATEYVDEMVSYSVFAHHIGSDFGGAGNLVRFVDNNQADIFANHQLFRGASSRANDDVGINGWQTAKNLNNALQAFYERILPNKYLAQFPVMQYENDTKAVLGENNEVVTEMKDGVNVITKDGQEIANGNKIFIPWEKDGEEEGKIYHWNREGGTSTWQLPKSWGNVSKVTIYELSDTGKGEAKELSVTDGTVRIDAKAKTGYVLYKDEAVKVENADTIEWSTGSPVKDMGFDSHNFDEWKPSSTVDDVSHITIENNDLGNSHLYIKGEKDGKVTQTLTGLEKGKTYSASVWCITDDGRKASIEVQNGDETVSNYMDRSNVTYGIHHNDKYQTKAQRMQVRFTAQSDTAVLTLAAETGDDAESVVDFDDVRVTKVGASTNPNPEKYTYWEDFENTDQGYGVFVSTESDQSHLAQLNPVNPEFTPDVIDGTYSLKVRAGDYMRTIPATLRLEPNTEYTVGIDYKSPTAGAFTLAVKSDKAAENGDTDHAVIASAVAEDVQGKLILKFETGNYDDYYVDVTKNNGTEYYVDNFYVEEARPINRETLGQLIDEAKALEESAYTPDSYKEMEKVLEIAETVQKDETSTREEIKVAYENLEEAIEKLVAYATEEDKAVLQSVVDEMKALLESDYKQDEAWMTFQTIIGEAEELLASNKTTKPETEEMARRLRTAKDNLTPYVDRSALKAIMEKAERVDRNTVVDGMELQTFLSSMEAAKAADLKPGVTEEEIQSAVQNLEDAYSKIVLKEESKNILVAEALERANEKENYFLEEDWQAIVEAKEALTQMRGQAEVYVKAYFETVDKLDGALENKLNRPVIPTSVEIDSSNFTVTANTEQELTGSEGPVELAFDKDESTFWHSNYAGGVSASNPARVTIDMGEVYMINQFSYLQRPTGGENGKVQRYNLYVKKAAGDEWTKVVDNASFENVKNVQKVSFDAVEAQYLLFEVTQGYGGFAAAAELAVYEKTSDFSALQQVMNDVDKLDKTLYMTESYETLMKLYKEAETLLDNVFCAQEDIDSLTAKLSEAKENLVLIADSTDIRTLEQAVADAENIALEDYKDTAAFELALKNAKEVLEKAESGAEVSKEETTNAALTLKSEQEKLVPAEEESELSTEVLSYAVELAKKADTTGVVQAVKDRYDAALKNAEDILAKVQAGDTSVTQSMIDESWQELVSVMQYLSFKQGDKTDLGKIIEMANSLNLKEFLEEGQDTFVKALETAKGVYADNNAMQKEVDETGRALLKAMSELRRKPDKDALEELLKKADSLLADKYETESFKAMREAAAFAREVFEDETATADEVETAQERLQAAMDGLKMISAGEALTDRKTNTKAYAKVDTKDNKTTDERNVKSVKTSDATNSAAPVLGILSAALAAVLAWRRKK